MITLTLYESLRLLQTSNAVWNRVAVEYGLRAAILLALNIPHITNQN